MDKLMMILVGGIVGYFTTIKIIAYKKSKK
jgi:hypothetical protein